MMSRGIPLTPDEYFQLDTLIERLHRLFNHQLDCKTFDLYIEPQVVDRDTGAEYSAFECLTDFIEDPKLSSLLLTGDAGMGKTLLSLYIAHRTWYRFIQLNLGGLLRTENQYWQKILKTENRQVSSKGSDIEKTVLSFYSLPLWIWMPSLGMTPVQKKPLLETFIAQNGLFLEEIQLLKDACQLRLFQLCPIMDGWDELAPGVVTSNLYCSSGFWADEGWPYLKALSTCRPEAFIHYKKNMESYHAIFRSPADIGHYKVFDLCSFEASQIEAYVRSYVKNLPHDYSPKVLPLFPLEEIQQTDLVKQAWLDEYQKFQFDTSILKRSQLEIKVVDPEVLDWFRPKTYLDRLVNLYDLAQTPFILSAIVQILPTIISHEQHYQDHTISRYLIYQYFIDDWLTKQATRIWSDREKRECLIDLKREDEAASICRLKECLLTYSENLARLALNLGDGKINVNLSPEDTAHPALVIPSPGKYPYFRDEPISKEKINLIRSGCLLKTVGNNFRFLHKSLVEFLAAKMLFQGAHEKAKFYLDDFDNQHYFKELDFNENLFTTESSIINLLADKARVDIYFKYLLYQMIERSKGEPRVSNAAANAITILNVAGESFSGRDFRGIQIPGAFLNNALCNETNFEGADLTNVSFQNAFLSGANFSRARTQGLDLYELPAFKHQCTITSLQIASDGKWLLVGDSFGYITQYSFDGKKLNQWYLSLSSSLTLLNVLMYVINIKPVTCLTLHSNQQFVACGGFNGAIKILDIRNNRWIAELIPSEIQKMNDHEVSLGQIFKITFCASKNSYLAYSFNFDKKLDGNPDNDFGYLQIWDYDKKNFLGQYKTKDEIVVLSTCAESDILVAREYKLEVTKRVLVFSLESYSGGSLIPIKTIKCNGPCRLSQDGKNLIVICDNVMKLYNLQNLLIKKIIPIPENLDEMNELAFSPKKDLVAAHTSTHLHFWNLMTGNYLYALPKPENIPDAFYESYIEKYNKKMTVLFYSFSNPHDLKFNELNFCLAISNGLHFIPFKRHELSLAYPRIPNFLPTFKKSNYHPSINNDRFDIEAVTRLDKSIFKHTVYIKNKLTDEVQKFHYGLIYTLSTQMAVFNNHYLIIRVLDDLQITEMKQVLPHSQVPNLLKFFLSSAEFFFKSVGGFNTYMWDLEKGRLHWEINSISAMNNMTLSADNEWLVYGEKDVLIYRIKDKKRIATLPVGADICCLILAADKRWVAVTNLSNDILIFDTRTCKLIYQLKNIPMVIQDLALTLDNQYLLVTGCKEGALTFRVWLESNSVYVKLIHNSIDLNLACNAINITDTHGLTAVNLQLLQQNNALGEPAQPDDLAINHGQQIRSLPKPVSFADAVVKRALVMSYLSVDNVLDYSLWQVALVRNEKSKNNRQHVFILVEGMDAFGRFFFWRFDLATRVDGESIREGFAKVVINTDTHNLLLSERESALDALLNPRGIPGRGLESLVGMAWQLERKLVLQLYHSVHKDEATGHLPYAQGGNYSLFSRGDSCYSWARRHLLALRQDKIKKQLPTKCTDYIAMVPSFNLKASLVPSAQRQKSTLC